MRVHLRAKLLDSLTRDTVSLCKRSQPREQWLDQLLMQRLERRGGSLLAVQQVDQLQRLSNHVEHRFTVVERLGRRRRVGDVAGVQGERAASVLAYSLEQRVDE